jgi:hypothetical protein
MDHITSDLDRLTIRERYMGDEQVQVGNGAGLQIMHTGHSSVNTAARSLFCVISYMFLKLPRIYFLFINFPVTMMRSFTTKKQL